MDIPQQLTQSLHWWPLAISTRIVTRRVGSVGLKQFWMYCSSMHSAAIDWNERFHSWWRRKRWCCGWGGVVPLPSTLCTKQLDAGQLAYKDEAVIESHEGTTHLIPVNSVRVESRTVSLDILLDAHPLVKRSLHWHELELNLMGSSLHSSLHNYQQHPLILTTVKSEGY